MSKTISMKIEDSLCKIDDFFWQKKLGANFKLFRNQAGKWVAHGWTSDENTILAKHSMGYQAAYRRNIDLLIKKSLSNNPKLECFVDLGSGLGKGVAVAAVSGKFKKVIGVELDIFLAKESQLIFSSLGLEIEILQADAGGYVLPAVSTLIFMFNPFDAQVLKVFLENNLAHFETHKSLIGYINHKNKVTLEEYGFQPVFYDDDRKISIWGKNERK